MAKQLKNLKQYNVRVRQELIDKLDKLALDYGAESGNKIAGEVIEQYLPFWEAAEMVRRQTLEDQRARLLGIQVSQDADVRLAKPVKKLKPRPTPTKRSG